MHEQEEQGREFPPIQTRHDGTTGWSTVLPLLLVGLLALMLLQTCIAR